MQLVTLGQRPGAPWYRGLACQVVLAATIILTSVLRGLTQSNPPSDRIQLALTPVYSIMDANGKMCYTNNPAAASLSPVFLAVFTNPWPAGLVPIFAVSASNGTELRRRPMPDEENTSEPLFFALPPGDEPQAIQVAGRWDCHGVRGDGSKVLLAWDLAVDGTNVSGRFDQTTDYRVASITGGYFRSNHLNIVVRHVADEYLLSGSWQMGGWAGDWWRSDNQEKGTWKATRLETRLPGSPEIVALYEYRRADGSLAYALDGTQIEAGWKRSSRPLCRVWRMREMRAPW